MREGNVKHLKQNGTLCFLDRPLEALTPTSDRPTASSRAAIETRYRERMPIYRRSSDMTFPVGEDFSLTVNDILKELSL